MRGARRGCVRLRGAIIGIDDEDDSTFTITTNSCKDDPKTFHFQTRNGEERERWVRALEDTILRHSHTVRTCVEYGLSYLFQPRVEQDPQKSVSQMASRLLLSRCSVDRRYDPDEKKTYCLLLFFYIAIHFLLESVQRHSYII